MIQYHQQPSITDHPLHGTHTGLTVLQVDGKHFATLNRPEMMLVQEQLIQFAMGASSIGIAKYLFEQSYRMR